MLWARKGPLTQSKEVKVYATGFQRPTHYLEPLGKHSAASFSIPQALMICDLEELVHSPYRILTRWH